MEVLTAADADRRQRAVAVALRRRGVGRGDRVVVAADAGAATLCAALGALRSGVVPVLLNSGLLPAERAALVADAEPALVLDGDDLTAVAEAPGTVDLAPVPLARPMHYTSGTTGVPKGVWSGVLDERAASELVDEERELWGFSRDDVHLVCSPLHHSAPLRFAAGTLLAGGTVVVLGRFDAETFRSAVATHRPTTTFCAPAHLQRLRASGGAGDVASFRLLAHAGAACPEPLKRWTLDELPDGTVWEFYGSTEGQFTACPPDEWLERPGTVGRARPGRRLEVDGDGTIWCHVPGHARFEYWRDPARSALTWRGSAFTVGDLGRLDDDGYLWLDGRRDDLVITGGVNVYPAEVEAVLGRLEGVVDVAVFGRDDDEWGQRVCAAVVGEVTPADVADWANRHLAAYKRPKEVHLVSSLPHTPTGKLRRSTLAADLNLDEGRVEPGA